MRSAPLLSALFIVSLALVGAGGTSHSGRWTGWVSDAKCGRKIDPDCNRRCLASGEAPVLVVDGSGDILAVANPEALRNYPGSHVIVSGTLSGSVLTVRSVKVPGCRRGDPQGSFQGSATSQEAGQLAVTANVGCVGGHYAGDLLTPVGDYSIVGGSFDADGLHLQFAGGAGVGSIEAKPAGETLQGTFRFSDDSGPIDLKRVGDAKLPAVKPAAPVLSAAQWREDLAAFARELPKRHANAFHHMTRERFDAEIADLDRRLEALEPDAIYVGLDRIASLIGDGHTYVQFPADTAEFPISLGQFGEEFRVGAVRPGSEKALGARVIQIQDTPIARARELVLQITPQDENPTLAEGRVSEYLTLGLALHGLGIIPDRRVARYVLEDDAGQKFPFEVRADNGSAGPWILPFQDQRLRTRKPEESFWCTYLSEARTVYCNFRGYGDLGKYSRGMLEMVRREKPEKLAIDMRQNGGGDYKEGLKYLIDPVRDLPDINRKGHLFVLIGPNTFSAAMSNAAQFRTRTAAILVGRTIGEKPNSYQEARQMTLPNSHLILHYSTQFYQFVESGENAVRPDREIPTSWEEWKAGQDPALDWVLKFVPAEAG
jgi:hypothetical protein